ncbi:phosphotransferase family protein [Microbacterium sp. NPDC055357]
MTSTPDGIEVVATQAEARRLNVPPLLIIDNVRAFLDAHGLGRGDLDWQRIGDGQSNITYRITRGNDVMVLRRGPRPPHPTSAHDMLREARLQQALREAGVMVPRVLATCDDDTLLGVPFYVMEFLDGIVIADEAPPALSSAEQRRDTVFAAVDALVALHSIDVTGGPLAGFGRPAGYLQRQVRLFSSLWEQNTQRDIPQVVELGNWLAAHVPDSQEVSVVHGDFRLGNLMYATTAPAKVAAILDWEMATLGDPLADLGYFTATYAEQNSTPTVMELTSVTREPGYPSKTEILDRYQSRLSLDFGALPWYQALALWKSAVFCEAMYTRWVNGERPGDSFAPSLEMGVPQLVDTAAAFVR